MEPEAKHSAEKGGKDLEYYEKALLEAVKYARLEEVKTILSSCNPSDLFSAHSSNPFHRPIISSAIYSWHESQGFGWRGSYVCAHSLESMKAILEALVQAGADINAPELYHHRKDKCALYTPVTIAMGRRNLGLCKLLVDMGADLKYKYSPQPAYWGEYQSEPLIDAVRAGPQFVSFVLEHNIHPIGQHGEGISELSRPLVVAINNYHPGVLEVFMDWYEAKDIPFPWRAVLEITFGYPGRDEEIARTVLHREYHLWNGDTPHLMENYFTNAASKQIIAVMRLLIQQRPQIVHAEWMSDLHLCTSLDTSDSCKQEFLSWFQRLQSQPLPLKLVCRNEILSKLGPTSKGLIGALPLPELMKEYLKQKSVL